MRHLLSDTIAAMQTGTDVLRANAVVLLATMPLSKIAADQPLPNSLTNGQVRGSDDLEKIHILITLLQDIRTISIRYIT
jgi:hypothetical protein